MENLFQSVSYFPEAIIENYLVIPKLHNYIFCEHGFNEHVCLVNDRKCIVWSHFRISWHCYYVSKFLREALKHMASTSVTIIMLKTKSVTEKNPTILLHFMTKILHWFSILKSNPQIKTKQQQKMPHLYKVNKRIKDWKLVLQVTRNQNLFKQPTNIVVTVCAVNGGVLFHWLFPINYLKTLE